MSNTINDTLMDKTQELLDYWTGTLWERIIQRDLDANDMEALQYHVDKAWAEMVLQEEYHL